MINATPMGNPSTQPSTNPVPSMDTQAPTVTPVAPPPTGDRPTKLKKKFNWKLLMGGLALLLLVVGAGVGLVLTQTNQDIRNQAYVADVGNDAGSASPTCPGSCKAGCASNETPSALKYSNCSQICCINTGATNTVPVPEAKPMVCSPNSERCHPTEKVMVKCLSDGSGEVRTGQTCGTTASTTTGCKNDCTPGAKACYSTGAVKTCVSGKDGKNDCYKWEKTQDCNGSSYCSNGQCVTDQSQACPSGSTKKTDSFGYTKCTCDANTSVIFNPTQSLPDECKLGTKDLNQECNNDSECKSNNCGSSDYSSERDVCLPSANNQEAIPVGSCEKVGSYCAPGSVAVTDTTCATQATHASTEYTGKLCKDTSEVKDSPDNYTSANNCLEAGTSCIPGTIAVTDNSCLDSSTQAARGVVTTNKKCVYPSCSTSVKANDCSCTNNSQCSSGYCQVSSLQNGVCKPATTTPTCTSTYNKPNNCACIANNQCSSGNCDTSTYMDGGRVCKPKTSKCFTTDDHCESLTESNCSLPKSYASMDVCLLDYVALQNNCPSGSKVSAGGTMCICEDNNGAEVLFNKGKSLPTQCIPTIAAANLGDKAALAGGSCTPALGLCDEVDCCDGQNLVCQGMEGARRCQQIGMTPDEFCGEGYSCDRYISFQCSALKLTSTSNGAPVCPDNPEYYTAAEKDKAVARAEATGCGQWDQVCSGGPKENQLCGDFKIINQTCGNTGDVTNPNPPVGPICSNITPSIATPKIGDQVTYTCGRVTGATSYDFKLVHPDGSIERQTGATSSNPSSVSQPFTITQAGKYTAQCRICVDGNCQNYELINQ